ncbi:MAG: multicopper oxidase domain-containing protein [Candidatus Bathyarchaeia archaeon]
MPLIAVIALAAIFYFSVMVVLVFNIQAPLTPISSVSGKTPTVSILLYEGEIPNSSLYGFGTSPNNLTSPGPTLRFTTSDVVNITVVNVGSMPHAFAITDALATKAKVLFNAEIGSGSNPLQPGQQGTVVFTPNNAGSSYYYICPVPGHVELGMYGSVVITSG